MNLQCGNDKLDLASEHWDFSLDHIPNEIKIDAEVVVNQSISHPRHRAPLHVGVRLTEFGRNIFCCLADDLEATYTRALQRRIFEEGFAINPDRRLLKLGSFVSDMPQVFTWCKGHPGLH